MEGAGGLLQFKFYTLSANGVVAEWLVYVALLRANKKLYLEYKGKTERKVHSLTICMILEIAKAFRIRVNELKILT